MTEITSKDLMHIGFLKKEKFTGSSEGMRYRIEKKITMVPNPEAEKTEENPEPEKEAVTLLATTWPEPFAYDHTPENVKCSTEYPFTEDGLEQARCWLNAEKNKDWMSMRLPWKGV